MHTYTLTLTRPLVIPLEKIRVKAYATHALDMHQPQRIFLLPLSSN